MFLCCLIPSSFLLHILVQHIWLCFFIHSHFLLSYFNCWTFLYCLWGFLSSFLSLHAHPPAPTPFSSSLCLLILTNTAYQQPSWQNEQIMRNAVPDLDTVSPSSSCLLSIWDYVNCYAASMFDTKVTHRNTRTHTRAVYFWKMPPNSHIDMTKTSVVNDISTEKLYWLRFSEQHTMCLSCKNQIAQYWMWVSDLAEVGVCLNTHSCFGSPMQLLDLLYIRLISHKVSVYTMFTTLFPFTFFSLCHLSSFHQ